VPQLADVANIEAVSFRQVASSELTVSDVIDLAEKISDAVADGATGTVITQGTNTIEETSFVLDLLWDREEPIVVTGAMRHPGLPGADGPAKSACLGSSREQPIGAESRLCGCSQR
jgi:L-asparaginase